jgi:RNA polymerase sigma-70 factor (ECF subfamily)
MMGLMGSALLMSATGDESDVTRLVELAVDGDQQAWASLMERYRGRLRQMIALRMDHRLQGRVDPSDVIQEACLAASNQISKYAANPGAPFYVWLRGIAEQRLIDQQRRHLETKIRGVNREVSRWRSAFSEATSDELAAQLMGRLGTPSQEAMRLEENAALQEAFNALEPIDREILALRHFEQLSNGEAAAVLGLDKSAASKRYGRALRRLKDVLLPRLGFDSSTST